MSNYYLRRTARVFVTIYLVATLTFGLIRLLPGGPYSQLRNELLQSGMSASEADARIETLQNINPDAPLWEQYVDYMAGFFQADLGMSIQYQDPVLQIVAEAAPWTVFIVGVSTVLVFAFGIVVGALQAYWEGSRFDKGMTTLSIGVMSIPFYLYAILLLYVLSYQLGITPTAGTVGSEYRGESLSIGFAISALQHAFLPILSYTIAEAGIQMLAMRGNSIQILGKDYVRVARLRGIADGRIATRYVARNAILPMYTGFLLLLGFRLGGTVILEEIFSYPGLGYYLLDALNSNDYPLMMGTFLIITVTLVIGVYVADLTYGKIDPRVKTGESNEAF